MKFKSFFIIFLCNLFILGCAQTPKKIRVRPERTKVKAKAPEVVKTSPPVVEVQKIKKAYRPKLGLVLGPGLARTFSHIGLLKKIHESEIPVSALVGLGWGAMPAYEYSREGVLHGLEWRVSRSEKLKTLLNTNFWKKPALEKHLEEAKILVSSLMTDKSVAREKGRFFCPVLKDKEVIFVKRKNLSFCVASSPIFNPGKAIGSYIFGLKEVVSKLKSEGIEKIIYVDVLSEDLSWGEGEKLIDGTKLWYWKMAQGSLRSDFDLFDHVIQTRNLGSLLNFKNPLKMIKKGEVSGEVLVRTLKNKYQF